MLTGRNIIHKHLQPFLTSLIPKSATMKTLSLYIFLTSLWASLSSSASLSPRVSTRVLAGVTVPDTPLIQAALDYARQHSTPGIYNHVIRSWLFGVIISSQVSALQAYDKELHAVSAILHDLGWDPTGALVKPYTRFEVDGANAARDFILSKDPTWEQRKLQLVWDSIALHATPSFALNKEVEVVITSRGTTADFSGPNSVTAPGLTWDEWNTIIEAFPRSGFKGEVQDIAIHLCHTKPYTIADNFIGEYGEKYIPGFNLTGLRPIDFLLSGVP